MAWTNIENEVVGSDELRRVCDLMHWNQREALGCLALLWKCSQKKLKIEATEREIAHWCQVAEGDESKRLIDALCDPLAGFLEPPPYPPHACVDEASTYFIAGNPKHVGKLRKLKKSSQIGGQVTRERWKKQKRTQIQTLDAEPNGQPNEGVQALKTGPNDGPIQFNSTAIQCNAIQEDKYMPIAEKPRPAKVRFDFEKLYREYPRKEGKSRGLKICAREIKTPEEYQALDAAIRRFTQHHVREKTERQYIPHFSTFMAAWHDWLDPETGTAEVGGQGELLDPETARMRRELALLEAQEGDHDCDPV